jgi:hypothetical protein
MQRKQKQRHIPMPIQMVLTSKHLFAAPGALERAVIVLTCRYWAAECPPEGMTDTAARELAKMDGATWERVKMPLRAALDDLLPSLAREYDIQSTARKRMRDMLRANGEKGRITIMRERKERAVNANGIPNTSTSSPKRPLVTPSRKPGYVDDTAALKPTETATINRKKPVVALLRD